MSEYGHVLNAAMRQLAQPWVPQTNLTLALLPPGLRFSEPTAIHSKSGLGLYIDLPIKERSSLAVVVCDICDILFFIIYVVAAAAILWGGAQSPPHTHTLGGGTPRNVDVVMPASHQSVRQSVHSP